MAEQSERKKLAEERREQIEGMGGQAFFPDVGTLSLSDMEQTEDTEVDK
jgi:hypothetical protein